MDYGKKFIIIGNMNAITYKEIFPYVKEDKLWWGASITSGDRKFYVPDNYPLEAAGCGIDEDGRRFIRVKGVRWWTNLTNAKRNTPLDLYKRYSNEYKEYPKYDNYDAININKTSDIPMDYDGVMGVPITFFDKYCPEQFEIVGCDEPAIEIELYKKASYFKNIPSRQIIHNGKLCQKTYHRLFIRKKKMKKFIIIGNQNSIMTKDIFKHFMNNEMWLGVSMNGANRWFYVPDKYEVNEKAAGYKVEDGKKMFFVNGVVWYTNISNIKRNTPIDLYKRYSNEYPHYENYDAIEVGRVENIPADYDGVMGVPLTFMQKYNPAQFEIVGMCENEDLYNLKTKKYTTEECKNAYFAKFGKKGTYDLNASGVIIKNGKLEKMYSRILIRKKK